MRIGRRPAIHNRCPSARNTTGVRPTWRGEVELGFAVAAHRRARQRSSARGRPQIDGTLRSDTNPRVAPREPQRRFRGARYWRTPLNSTLPRQVEPQLSPCPAVALHNATERADVDVRTACARPGPPRCSHARTAPPGTRRRARRRRRRAVTPPLLAACDVASTRPSASTEHGRGGDRSGGAVGRPPPSRSKTWTSGHVDGAVHAPLPRLKPRSAHGNVTVLTATPCRPRREPTRCRPRHEREQVAGQVGESR